MLITDVSRYSIRMQNMKKCSQYLRSNASLFLWKKLEKFVQILLQDKFWPRIAATRFSRPWRTQNLQTLLCSKPHFRVHIANLFWFLVASFATEMVMYTAGLLSLLGELPNAADHGATLCVGIASPKPWAASPLRSDCNLKIRGKMANLYNNPQM